MGPSRSSSPPVVFRFKNNDHHTAILSAGPPLNHLERFSDALLAPRLSPPPCPPFARGGKTAASGLFSPLARGDTGGCFECLCVVPGSSSTRLKIALVHQAASRRQLRCHRDLRDMLIPCRGLGTGLTRLGRAAARASEATMMTGTPSHGFWGRSRSRGRAASTAGYCCQRGRGGAAHEVAHERRADWRTEPRRCVGTAGRATAGRARAEARASKVRGPECAVAVPVAEPEPASE